MKFTLREPQVGSPQSFESLAVFPIFYEVTEPVTYLLSRKALEQNLVTVSEVSEAGSVPELLVVNEADQRVLFLEGEELQGAKQNRILNTSVLVPPHSRVSIPVSCVEQGRWSYRSRSFTSGQSYSPSKLRYALKASTSRSLKSGRGHRSDQGKVWEEVARQQASLGVESATGAMSETFESKLDMLAEYLDKIQYVDGALGLVVAVGGQLVGADFFDQPSTCREVWNRLLSGAVLEALASPTAGKSAGIEAVEALLGQLTAADWQAVQPVGEGEEHRVDDLEGALGSSLTLNGTLVHASVAIAT